MAEQFAAPAFAFILSLIGAFLLTQFAASYRFVSKKNYRRLGPSNVPLLGGVSVYLAFNISCYFLCDPAATFKFLCATAPLVIVGIADDLWELSAKTKSCFQILTVATWLVQTAPQELILVQLGCPQLLGVVLCGFWVFGMMNATNMIDGIDGLAASFAIIGCVAASFLPGIVSSSILRIMAAAYAGFLIRNFAPAKIYLGDLGSQLIGFFLASQLMIWQPQIAGRFDLLIPLMIFALPQVDALLAIYRRIRSGVSPFSADREHLHHKVLRTLGNVRTTWSFMSIIMIICVAVALEAAAVAEFTLRAAILASTVVTLIIVLWWTVKTEQVMANRAADLGRYFVSKHAVFESDLSWQGAIGRAVKYDLRPYYRELQSRTTADIENFANGLAEFLERSHRGAKKFFSGSSCIFVVEGVFDASSSLEDRIAEQFFEFTKKFRIQVNQDGRPLGLKLDAKAEFSKLMAKTVNFAAASKKDSPSFIKKKVSPPMDLIKKMILVVDDDADILEILVDEITRRTNISKHQIVTAKSGYQAIQFFNSGYAFDFIVLDHEMPNGSGSDVIHFLNEAKISIPTVLFTGSSDVKILSHARSVVGVIDKTELPMVIKLVLKFTAASATSITSRAG